MSRVYLAPCTSAEPEDVLAGKLETLWRKAGLEECVAGGGPIALKLHVGEPGKDSHVRPFVARTLVRLMGETGGRPFLTDTAVLYRSPRDSGIGHALVAHQHGFGVDAVGAPFLPADGLVGNDDVDVPVEGARHHPTASIATGIAHARSLIVLSHATGHLATGYGGALKNLGMGCCSRKAKLRQHHGHEPRVEPGACTACGICAAWCPAGAIAVTETASIDPRRCIGCGECLAVCQDGAIAFDWGITGPDLQERIVEHAIGALHGKRSRVGFVTVLMQVTKDCDCMRGRQRPLLRDIGFLASRDPVSIDRAALDLIRERAGRTLESMSYPRLDGTHQLRYAARLGLGEDEADIDIV